MHIQLPRPGPWLSSKDKRNNWKSLRLWQRSAPIPALIAMMIVVFGPGGTSEAGASALCQAGVHYYAGEDLLSSLSYGVSGIERFLSKPTIATVVDYTNQIAAAIMGNYAHKTATATPKVCYEYDGIYTCHLQAAIAVGNLGGQAHTQPTFLAEEWTYYGYYVFWRSQTVHSNSFLNSYWVGTTVKLSTGYTLGLFDSYSAGPAGNTTVHFVGTAWLNYYGHQGDTAYYEYTSPATYVCPRIKPYLYYGTNGSGSTNTGYVLAYYKSTRTGWVNFPTASTRYDKYADTPYFYYQITSYRAFKVEGGVAT